MLVYLMKYLLRIQVGTLWPHSPVLEHVILEYPTSKYPVSHVNVTVSPLVKPPDICPLFGALIVGQLAATSKARQIGLVLK